MGGVFHFLKDVQARGLGDHDFFFFFRGEGLFFFQSGWVRVFKYLIFGYWRCRGHLDLSEVFYFFIIGCGFMF